MGLFLFHFSMKSKLILAGCVIYFFTVILYSVLSVLCSIDCFSLSVRFSVTFSALACKTICTLSENVLEELMRALSYHSVLMFRMLLYQRDNGKSTCPSGKVGQRSGISAFRKEEEAARWDSLCVCAMLDSFRCLITVFFCRISQRDIEHKTVVSGSVYSLGDRVCRIDGRLIIT